MAKIRRENWKGKLFSVARDESGRFVTFERWKPKRNIEFLNAQLKQTGTFKKDIVREVVSKKTGTIEYMDFSPKPRIPSGIDQKQYIIQARAKGQLVVTRSRQLDRSVPTAKLKKEAEQDFVRALAKVFDASYDDVKLIHMPKLKIRQGLVYYKFKKK